MTLNQIAQQAMKILDDYNICGEYEIASGTIDDEQELNVYYLGYNNVWCLRSISCWELQKDLYVYSRCDAFLNDLIRNCEVINIIKNKHPQKSPA